MNDRKPVPPFQSESTEFIGTFQPIESGTNRRLILVGGVILAVLILVALVILPRRQQTRSQFTGYRNYLAIPIANAAEINPWARAVEKVREDRGESMGGEAVVRIPHQVRHYSDTRRFLATQTAEVREHGVRTPGDLLELAALIQTGDMVPLENVTDNYVVTGAGGTVDTGPFTIYRDGKRIPVLNENGLEQEQARLSDTAAALEQEISEVRRRLNTISKRNRAKRLQLQSQVSALTAKAKATRGTLELLQQHYRTAEKRTAMLTSYRTLEKLANSFPDRTYDLESASDRRALKMRMLRSLRPEAIKVLNELAAAYREKFDRPLPITSLVRPDEYQHLLAKVNPNATLIATPPHSTGLAFDVSYRYMASAEQAHLMAHLAELKDARRIEVLRETRNHYHVFAFVDGARPSESLIVASLGSVGRTPQKRVISHHAKKQAGKRKRR